MSGADLGINNRDSRRAFTTVFWSRSWGRGLAASAAIGIGLIAISACLTQAKRTESLAPPTEEASQDQPAESPVDEPEAEATDVEAPTAAEVAPDARGQEPDAYSVPLPTGLLHADVLDPAVIVRTFEEQLTQAGAERVHLLVQLREPPESSDIERLAEEGVVLLDPLTRHTWHAAISRQALSAISGERSLRWAGAMTPEDKLAAGAGDEAEPPEHQRRSEGRLAYTTIFHKDVTAAEVRALADRLDLGLESFDEASFPVLRSAIVVLAPGMLRDFAAADIVQRVEPAPAPPVNHNLTRAQPLSNVDTVQAAPYNLDGSGVIVGVWEAQSGQVDAAQLDLAGRVFVQPGEGGTLHDHASHVAGTVGSSGANITNAEGMAPNVTISSWDAADDAAEMIAAATPSATGLPARVTNHSYGLKIGWTFDPAGGWTWANDQANFGRYDANSQAFDNVVAQAGLVVVVSAGNHRNDAPATPTPGQPADCTQGGFGVAADCLGPRASAKNVIAVGAMNGANAIANFSSFGPTDDGRIKPDIVAQGVSMLSLASSNFFSDGNQDGIDDVPDSTTASTTMSGTSMSAPVVSGIAALLLQDAATNGVALTPAGLRALLFHSARDVAGTGQATVGPDYATGWGIADAAAAVNLLRDGCLSQASLAATGTASAWTQSFYVPADLPETKVTLVWDDPAGTPGGQILVNDLDLRLIAPDNTVFRPWTLNPASPGLPAVRNGGNDAANNVEQVSVLNPMAGTWTAQVSAAAGNLPLAPQAFALACLPANASPTIDIGSDRSAEEGELLEFKAKITDTDVGDEHQVTWSWGDGPADSPIVTDASTTASFEVPGEHRWGDDGNYTLTASVQDFEDGLAKGEPVSVSVQVLVGNVAPTVDAPRFEPTQPWPGQAIELHADFQDPGWLDEHEAEARWIVGEAATEGQVSKAHTTWDEAGAVLASRPNGLALPDAYNVELCVTDDDGAKTCVTEALRVEMSPEMPGVFDTSNEWTFLSWTGALPGTLAEAENQWREGSGVANLKWIYEAEGWLYFFQKTPGDTPNFDPDQDPDADDNWLAYAVPKDDFQQWLWCGIQIPTGAGATTTGCHPRYSPPPHGAGDLHPWISERIDESRPHILAMLESIFD